MVMLDTNICIHILKNSPDYVRERLKSADQVSISTVVYAELSFGIKWSPERLQGARQERLTQFISLLNVISWDDAAADHYADIRAVLQREGNVSGNMDMLIAAHARSLKETLVSNNLREFERVEGLRLDNWVSKSIP